MSEATSITIVEDSTCLACGCLCDDIRVVVEGDRVVEAENACPIGRPWFLASRPGEGHPPSTIDGQPAPFDEAIARAAELLSRAKAPVIWGLSGTSIETAREALAIADRIGAVVDLGGPPDESGRLAAFQRLGQVSGSLGEVADRADVVVFWGVDPLATHPRHWERYSVEPKGRFVPAGRSGRFVIVVDRDTTATARAADLFVPIEPGRQAETLEVLRAMIKGIAVDPDRAARASGLPYDRLEVLADRLRGAEYGAFFSGPSLGAMAAGPALTLVRDLNDGRRFVALELGGPGNPAGASALLTWQGGAPSSVDFGLGHPRHLPGEATLAARLAVGEVDVVLAIADDPRAALSADELARLASTVLIRIAPGATIQSRPDLVAFDVARTGIEAGGTVGRVDGLMLPLRPSIRSSLPTDRFILEALRGRLVR